MIVFKKYLETPISIEDVKKFLKIDNNADDDLIDKIIKSVDDYIFSKYGISVSKKEITLVIKTKVEYSKILKIYPIDEILNFRLNNSNVDVSILKTEIGDDYVKFLLKEGINEITLLTNFLIDERMKLKMKQHCSILYENRENFNEDIKNSIEAIYSDQKKIIVC